MPKSKVRELIGDLAWKQLEGALAEAKHSAAGAPPDLSDRDFLEAMLHLNRTGSPWRDLPPELGCWHAVYMRFRRWEARGVWQRLWKTLPAERFAQAVGLLLDSTTVRAHQHAAGAPKKNGPAQALGRSRGGFSTKIHAATLDENCAGALHLTAGQAHDGRQFQSLYESLDPDNVLEFAALDRGCDADRIRERLASDEIEPVIPPIRTHSEQLPYDKPLYRGRNRVERFFNKLKQFRRIATRYFAAVCLSAFLIARNSRTRPRARFAPLFKREATRGTKINCEIVNQRHYFRYQLYGHHRERLRERVAGSDPADDAGHPRARPRP